MPLEQKLPDVRTFVTVHLFNALRREPTRDHSICDVRQVEIVPLHLESLFVCRDQLSDPVGVNAKKLSFLFLFGFANLLVGLLVLRGLVLILLARDLLVEGYAHARVVVYKDGFDADGAVLCSVVGFRLGVDVLGLLHFVCYIGLLRNHLVCFEVEKQILVKVLKNLQLFFGYWL